MKWTPGGESQDIEDRRDDSGGGGGFQFGGMHLGIGGAIILLILSFVFRTNFFAMLGGFGLVAWPAHWGNTGVMTFVVNQDGDIYEKDLGSATATIAKGMTRFDPDPTWQKVGAPAPITGETDDD